jgi:hypothetical protein
MSVVDKLARESSPWAGRGRRRRRADASPAADETADAILEAVAETAAEVSVDGLVEEPTSPRAALNRDLLLERLGPEAFGKWKM